MKILTIIPARGGSKGIPGKNVKLIAGRPLVAHSIVQARQTPSINRIVVSTDDKEIATVASGSGAEIVPRPPEISNDTAPSEAALLHVLDFLKHKEGYEPDLVVFLQATSPFRSPGEIQNAIDTLLKEKADSLLSVGPVHGFVWRVEKDGLVRSFSYDHLSRPRRQDAPEDLIENGSIYVFKPWVLRQFNNRLGGKIALHRMSAVESFQIDEPGDIELIEALMAFQDQKQKIEDTSQNSKARDKRSEVGRQFSGIKLLVLDFDGVLTDNRVLVTEDGKESVLCNRGDGLGIEMLKAAGVEVVVISKEKNPVVAARCRKLRIECIQACDNKLKALQQMAQDKGRKADEIAYVGNDVNDLECMRWAGLPIAVHDAHAEALGAAKWLTQKAGGHGAVREVCDLLVKSIVRGE